jgi:lipid II:glycine glycyltransferase (peptidoglycan interpeptide bridge formation enzyme)
MIKMTEYMALGKPIVAFDLPEHRVTAQAAALYVPPNDELEFARALAQLMDDPARRQAMGSFGRRRIEMELAWRYSVPKLLEAYRTLFPEPPGESLPSYDTIQKGDRMIVRDSSTPGHLCLKRDPDGSLSAGYHIRISHAAEDPEWDAFLAETPGGHHVQTSLWAQVKAALGWRIARIVVTQGEHIVAGGQVLLRPLPVVGAIGYVPRGPLFAVDDPVLAELVINELHQVARVHRVQYLVVQPPCNGEALAHSLSTWGFRPSKIEVAPTATVVIDLSMDLDDILGQMKSKTRYNIRHGQRKGITVREGTERDLSTFHRLLVATSRRQKFPSEPEEYYVKMWRVLGSRGYAKLFLGELEGEPVSALLAISFGDTVIYKRGAWSGCHGGRHPNYVLQWAAIMWAKSHGYHYYDLEGIELEAALAIMDDEPIPDSLKQSVTSFKLGFGGEMVLHPGAYDYVYHPLLRRAYNIVFPKIANWSVTKTALHRFRTH